VVLTTPQPAAGKEQEFVNDIASRTVWREPTERQGKWLKSIFYRLGERRP